MNSSPFRWLALGGLLMTAAGLWPWLVLSGVYASGLTIAVMLSLPLLLALPGTVRGQRRTLAACSLLANGYIAFAIVETFSIPQVRAYALFELISAALWFLGCVCHLRLTRAGN